MAPLPNEPAVQVKGLREFRKELRAFDKQTDKELAKELKTTIAPILADARERAPKRTGALSRSLRPFAVAKGAGIRSNLPYAQVVHWGGTIRPRGVPIKFKRTEFITKAVEGHEARIVAGVGDAIERAARSAGWK